MIKDALDGVPSCFVSFVMVYGYIYIYALLDKHVDDVCIEEPVKSGINLMAVFPVSNQPFRE